MSEGYEYDHLVDDVEESCCVEGHEEIRSSLAAVARQRSEDAEAVEGAGEALEAVGATRISPSDAGGVAAADGEIGDRIGSFVDGLLQMMRFRRIASTSRLAPNRGLSFISKVGPAWMKSCAKSGLRSSNG